MRLLLVVCVAILVGLFLILAFAALAPSCDQLVVNAVDEFWCLSDLRTA